MITGILKSLLCLASLFVFLIVSIISHILLSIICPGNRWVFFSYLNRLLSMSLCGIAGVRIVIQGKTNIPAKTGNLIISNHLSYLDGVILGSIFPVIYLSKQAVKSWPLIGWMTFVSGTIFIDRKRKDESPKYVEEISRKLACEANVLLFAEGTSTNGESIREFQSVFFQAPLTNRSFILPVAIRYTRINSQTITDSTRDEICWYGQVPFYRHIWRLLHKRSVEAIVSITPPINTSSSNLSLDRKGLARQTHQIISKEYFKTNRQ